VLQRPIASCPLLLLPPKEEEGMGVQSPGELQGCLGAVGLVPWPREGPGSTAGGSGNE